MAELKFGLRRMTLLDFPGKVACTVFIPGCNFRCPFCHNASLVTGMDSGELISREELFRFLRSRTGLLDGVAVTGGEPLLYRETLQLLRDIRTMGYRIKLDTNGSFPELLNEAVTGGLADYVAMDIKNSPEKYLLTCGGRDALKQVRESVDLLLAGKTEYEFRTTAVGGLHTAADIAAIGGWITGARHYFLQKFVDSGDLLNGNPEMDALTDADMLEFLNVVRKYVPTAEIRGV